MVNIQVRWKVPGRIPIVNTQFRSKAGRISVVNIQVR
jgi:hypothetical protein